MGCHALHSLSKALLIAEHYLAALQISQNRLGLVERRVGQDGLAEVIKQIRG